jgi:hypothetical protein
MRMSGPNLMSLRQEKKIRDKKHGDDGSERQDNISETNRGKEPTGDAIGSEDTLPSEGTGIGWVEKLRQILRDAAGFFLHNIQCLHYAPAQFV